MALGARAAALPVADLPGVGAKSPAQVATGFIHVRVGLLAADGQSLYGGACASFGNVAGIRDRAFKLLAALLREYVHDVSARLKSECSSLLWMRSSNTSVVSFVFHAQ